MANDINPLLPNVNPDDPQFIAAVKKLKEGDTLDTLQGQFIVEGKASEPTHYRFHQRIFPAGVILNKVGSNLRIFIEAEKLGMQVTKHAKGTFTDRQIDKDGKVLPPTQPVKKQKPTK